MSNYENMPSISSINRVLRNLNTVQSNRVEAGTESVIIENSPTLNCAATGAAAKKSRDLKELERQALCVVERTLNPEHNVYETFIVHKSSNQDTESAQSGTTNRQLQRNQIEPASFYQYEMVKSIINSSISSYGQAGIHGDSFTSSEPTQHIDNINNDSK